MMTVGSSHNDGGNNNIIDNNNSKQLIKLRNSIELPAFHFVEEQLEHRYKLASERLKAH